MTAQSPEWLRYAGVAPSAHNTQPWKFAIFDDGTINVGWSRERELTASDPTNRDLYLALGTAIEAAYLGSGLAGLRLAFNADESQPRVVGRLSPNGANELSGFDRNLALLLPKRQTGRIAHHPGRVSPAVLSSMKAEADASGCKLYVMEDQIELNAIATLSREATAAQFADADVHAELWNWLRLDKMDPRYQRDGLTADCLNLDGIALALSRVLLPPAQMRVLVRLGLHNLLAADTEMLVKKSSSVCLLTAPDLSRSTLLRAGRALLRVWLIATSAGLTTHPVSALLDCAATVLPTTTAFGAGEPAAAIFRLGETGAVPRAPRLPLAELLQTL